MDGHQQLCVVEGSVGGAGAEAGDGPIVLVVAPTRELAMQIQEECHKFGASSRIKHTCVYGGVPKGPQVKDLKAGAPPPPLAPHPPPLSPRRRPRSSALHPPGRSCCCEAA